MKAWELLEQTGWCQGAFARDKDGYKVRPESAEACKFCVYGALSRAYGYVDDGDYRPENDAFWDAADRLATHLQEFITVWNDAPGRTKEEVIAAMQQADV